MPSELRRDPIRNDWVIISPERAHRPLPPDAAPAPDDPSACPFCPGREAETPPEIHAIRGDGSPANGPGWELRVIPNRYPALEEGGSPRIDGPVLRRRRDGLGVHELIIESPRHVPSWTDLDVSEVERALRVIRGRLAACRLKGNLRYALLFKNVGREAGASLGHTHSQIVATPILPAAIDQEARMARRYWRERRRCVFCDVVRTEADEGRRIVRAGEWFVSFCPYASRFPLEVWILPTAHASTFEGLPDFLLEPLARLIRDVLFRIESCTGRPRYNLLLHTSPFRLKEEETYHWHIELMPRTGTVAGFEWGSGLHVNPVPPEEAARLLRGASADGRGGS